MWSIQSSSRRHTSSYGGNTVRSPTIRVRHERGSAGLRGLVYTCINTPVIVVLNRNRPMNDNSSNLVGTPARLVGDPGGRGGHRAHRAVAPPDRRRSRAAGWMYRQFVRAQSDENHLLEGSVNHRRTNLHGVRMPGSVVPGTENTLSRARTMCCLDPVSSGDTDVYDAPAVGDTPQNILQKLIY